MKKLCICIILLLMFPFSCIAATPVLKYSNAGTYPLWTEEAYYCAPTVVDLNGDGKNEIVFSNYSITVLDGASGAVLWKVNSGRDRSAPLEEFGASAGHTWSSLEVADIDGDGGLEIVSLHGNGLISVLDANGYFEPGWPQTPLAAAGRSLEVADIDGDGKSEIIVGYGVDSPQSVYVLSYDGQIRSGWPQMDNTQYPAKGWSYGVFMDGIETADLDSDGQLEIIVPTDNSFVSIYKPNGTLMQANSSVYGDRTWAQVAFYEDPSAEIRGDNEGWGWSITGNELREDLYRAEFGHGAVAVADVDGDGKKELAVTGIMCNRKYAPSYPPTEYMTVFLLNADRTRYANWSLPPTDLGAPLLQSNVSIASMVQQTPVIEDLDGDGKPEILFNSYNGKVHCFNLDKKEPYAWPYSLTKRTSPMLQYATAPVCRDLDGDGKKEVIFATFYDSEQGLTPNNVGSLCILNYEGKLISSAPLPPAKEAGNYPNGAMAAPAVADVDGDGLLEIVVNTLHGAICVYDLV